MNIRIAHPFPCTPREYWELTRRPEFEAEVSREADVDIEVVERRQEGPLLIERLRLSPRRELPALAQRALGAARFAYMQESTANNDDFTTQWNVVPELLAGKIRCSGTARVVPAPGGCERVIEGEIRVSLPLIGGTVEKHVLDLITKSYDRAAELVRKMLPGRA